MKKYELTDERIIYKGRKLYRIKALRSFGNVKEGDLGGFVESEKNLSHGGTAWIYDNAKVFDSAIVYDQAGVYDGAEVYEYAKVSGNAKICENSEIYDNADVGGYTEVSGCATIFGHAFIRDKAKVYNCAWISGCAVIHDNAQIFGDSWVSGDVEVYDNTKIYGDISVSGSAKFCKNANIQGKEDYACVDGFGRACRSTTFFKESDRSVKVVCGCFYGDIESFRSQVKKTHGDSKYAKEYLMIANLMELHFKEE